MIKGKVIRKNRLTNLIDRRTFMSEQTNYMGRLIKVAGLVHPCPYVPSSFLASFASSHVDPSFSPGGFVT